jgi:hypothetical protein
VIRASLTLAAIEKRSLERPRSNREKRPITSIVSRRERALTHTTSTVQAVRRPQSLIVMIGAKTMTRKLCGRLLTISAVSISVTVVTISPSLTDEEPRSRRASGSCGRAFAIILCAIHRCRDREAVRDRRAWLDVSHFARPAAPIAADDPAPGHWLTASALAGAGLQCLDSLERPGAVAECGHARHIDAALDHVRDKLQFEAEQAFPQPPQRR